MEPVDDDLSDDDGFYFPIIYLMRTWDAYRSFGVLPDAGGINDQNPRWWDDINRLNRRYAYIKQQLQMQQEAADEVNKLIGDTNGPNWQGITHG